MAENEEEVEDEFAEEGAEGGKKKLLIIGIAVAVLLVIGGAAAFMLLGGDAEEAGDDEAAEEVAEADQPDGERVPYFYAVPKDREAGLVISLEPGTGYRQAQVSFRILTYSAALKDYLAANDPMIRHYLINTMTTTDTAKFLNKSGRIELQASLTEMLRDILAKSANEEEQQLADQVENVYFNTFVLQ